MTAVQSGESDQSYRDVAQASRRRSKKIRTTDIEKAENAQQSATDRLARIESGIASPEEMAADPTGSQARLDIEAAKTDKKKAKAGHRARKRTIRKATRRVRPGIFEEGIEDEGELLQEQTEMNRWKKIAGLNENKK